jgi:hypothetical protein
MERAGGINRAPSRIGLAESNPRERERSNIGVHYATAYDARRISRALLGDDRSTWFRWKTLHGAAS